MTRAPHAATLPTPRRKSVDQPIYPRVPGQTKDSRRDTTAAVIGVVTGTLTRPLYLFLGRLYQDGRLRTVGRNVPLRPDVSQQVGV
ncbi:hypothetical protein ABZ924_31520 [Streptomyces sp. NPDC046876]|uniref:hypothetical protein n=1 Tax=Streptomyces sp. NPDC046876 TaxID=3155616 RepID=UPI0033F942F8